jgi:hypothetical protein
MARLHEHLKYFVNKKLSSDPTWQKVEIILSGHDVGQIRERGGRGGGVKDGGDREREEKEIGKEIGREEGGMGRERERRKGDREREKGRGRHGEREGEGGGVLSIFSCGGDDTAFPEHVYLWWG